MTHATTLRIAATLAAAVSLAVSAQTQTRPTPPASPAPVRPITIDKPGVTTAIDISPLEVAPGGTVKAVFTGTGKCKPSVDWGNGETKSFSGVPLDQPVTFDHQYEKAGKFTVAASGCGMQLSKEVVVAAKTKPVGAGNTTLDPASIPGKITALVFTGGYLPAWANKPAGSIGHNFPIKLRVEGTGGKACGFKISWPSAGAGGYAVAAATFPHDWAGIKFPAGTHTLVAEGVASANAPACAGNATLTVSVVEHPMAPVMQ